MARNDHKIFKFAKLRTWSQTVKKSAKMTQLKLQKLTQKIVKYVQTQGKSIYYLDRQVVLSTLFIILFSNKSEQESHILTYICQLTLNSLHFHFLKPS